MIDADKAKIPFEWKSMMFDTVEVAWAVNGPPWAGAGTRLPGYLFFCDHATGRQGEIYGDAVTILHSYMDSPWSPLVGFRLKTMGSILGGDCSEMVLDKFKEDETDRRDMWIIRMDEYFKEIVNKPQDKNIQAEKLKIQSQVWQKQSGLKNTVPKPLPTMCFTTPVNKLK
jgi:hypothetical protein